MSTLRNYVVYIINGVRVSDSVISGIFTLKRRENEAAIASIPLLLPTGSLTISSYTNATVKVLLYDSTLGTGVILFTGVVSKVDLDLINRRVMLTCTDNRKQLMLAASRAYVESIGYYSRDLAVATPDQYAELSARVSSIPYSLTVSASGALYLSNMLYSGSLYRTLGNSDVYSDESGTKVQISLSDRSNIINTVNISSKYRYNRFYGCEVSYTWNVDYNGGNFYTDGFSLPPKTMIKAAIDGMKWPIYGQIAYTDPPPDGLYGRVAYTSSKITSTTVAESVQRPNNATSATSPSLQTLTISREADVSNATAPNLNAFQPRQVISTAIVSNFAATAAGAAWLATNRWTQSITEEIEITVSAPQSITAYGTIADNASVNFEAKANTKDWAPDPVARARPTGQALTVVSGYWYFNDNTKDSNFINATLFTLNRASTMIKLSHRSNYITVSMIIDANIKIGDNIYLNCTKVQAQGVVSEINHMIDTVERWATTTITIAVATSTGSSSDSTLIATRIGYTPVAQIPSGISLPTRYGINPATADPNNTWTGYIGNKVITERSGPLTTAVQKTGFTESFIVDAPIIPSDLTRNLSTTGTASFTVNLQNNTLSLTL